MKVLYDYQIFREQRYGGISKYFTNLIRYAEEGEAIVPCFHSKNYYYNKFTGGFDHKYESMLFEEINNTISKIITKRRLKKGDIKIFHPTSNDTYFIKQLNSEKTIITIHDLAIERFPERFSNAQTFIEKRKKLIQVADHIIAVSNNTKREIIDFYQVDPDKITVVYHGLPKEFGKISIHLRGLPEKYLLYVGQRNGNKNFDRFAEAFSKIAEKDSNISLLCIGGGEFSDLERQTMLELGLEKKVQQRNLNAAVLATCYKQAEAFVFPSIYEGFGIPILEAFAMKCPIILSDIGSFREIAGDHGTFFDPNNVQSIHETIAWVTDPENKEIIEQRVKEGSEALTEFTLETTYYNTHQVYESVVRD